MHKVDLSPSPELSYVIGTFFGDAFLIKNKWTNGYVIRLEATDKEFVEEFNKCVSYVIGKERGYSITPLEGRKNRKRSYVVQAYSKSLYRFLESPTKALHTKASGYPKECIRGFFDSEGRVRENGRMSAGNVNKEILTRIGKLLEDLDIHFTFHSYKRYTSSGKTMHYLCISRQKDIAKFRNKIGFTIERKKEKLDQAQLPKLERIKKYNKAMEFRKTKGWGADRIGKEIGVSKNTVSNWVYRSVRP